jgi:hypothetical protein
VEDHRAANLGAERYKTEFLLERDPAHAHLAAQLPKTITVRDAVNAFLGDKRGQNLQDCSVGNIPRNWAASPTTSKRRIGSC